MRATVRTLNENGQHALTTVRRACPARRPRPPPLAIAGGPRLLLDLDVAMVGDHRRPVAAARLGRREKEDCLFTAELCPHRQRASRAKPL